MPGIVEYGMATSTGNAGEVSGLLLQDLFSSDSLLADAIRGVANRHYSSYTRAELVTGYQRINTKAGTFSGQDDSTKSSMHFAKTFWAFLHGTGTDQDNSVKGAVDTGTPVPCVSCSPRQAKARALVIHRTPLAWFDQNNTAGTILKMAVDDLIRDIGVPKDELNDEWIQPNVSAWELESFTEQEIREAQSDLLKFISVNPPPQDMPVVKGEYTIAMPNTTTTPAATATATDTLNDKPKPSMAGFGLIAGLILLGILFSGGAAHE
jgi:hypothetical protein